MRLEAVFPISNFFKQIGESLGKGAFGTVYKGLNFETGETVAIKRIILSQLPASDLSSIEMELELLKKLNHPNIVQYIGLFRSENHFNIILEFVESGSLLNILKKFGNFPETLTSVYTTQILEGLAYLHQREVIHRDIKASNLLTTKDGLVKLADFGVATIVKAHNSKELCGTFFGSPYWMAPEIIAMEGAYTSSDIWSLGCTILELLTGEPPFYSMPQISAMYHIVESGEAPPYPECISFELRDFLDKCFERDPRLRHSAVQLLEHAWIVSNKSKYVKREVNPSSYASKGDIGGGRDRFAPMDRAVLRSRSSRALGLADELGELSELEENLEDLRQQVVLEVRAIQLLEIDVRRLDKKIELLIKNRISLEELIKSTNKASYSEGFNRRASDGMSPSDSINFWKNGSCMEVFAKIFYLLQTRPGYLTNFMFFHFEGTEKFIETLILTLFGFAFSPREEYLLLQLFEVAIRKEIANLTSINEFSDEAYVLLAMIMAYSRRVEEKKFLCGIFGPCIDRVRKAGEVDFEYDYRKVFNKLLNYQEMNTGKVNMEMKSDATDTEIFSNAKVREASFEAAKRLVEFSDYFYERILESKSAFPYGLRYILKLLERELSAKFKDQFESIMALLGYVVYYRFMNPAIVVPEEFQMESVTLEQRTNLAAISRVLSNIMNNKALDGEGESISMINNYIGRRSGQFSQFLLEIIQDVPDPAEYLDIDQLYLEYTLTTHPVIYISPNEMLLMHKYLLMKIDNIAPDPQDVLRKLVESLSSLPTGEFSDPDFDREISVVLQPVLEDVNGLESSNSECAQTAKVYSQTKKLMSEIIKGSFKDLLNELDLLELLTGPEATRHPNLNQVARQILGNLEYLEAKGLVSKSDHYKSVLVEIQRDLWQRATLRSKLLRNHKKLQNTLEKLKEKHVFLDSQLAAYNEYVKACLEQMVLIKKKKATSPKKGERRNFVKYSCSSLIRKGVIVQIDVPTSQQVSLSFEIEESPDVGVFFVIVYAAFFAYETITIELADLLEKQHNGVYYLELMEGKVKLRLNLLIHILNKLAIK